MARYAEGTTVAPEKSEVEIKTLLRKRGATEVWSGSDEAQAMVGFKMQSRLVKLVVTFPPRNAPPYRHSPKAWDAEVRRLWRALLLSIKAKLEVVDSQIETFEVAFMAHIVMPDGSTVADAALPAIAAMYASGRMPTGFLQLGSGVRDGE